MKHVCIFKKIWDIWYISLVYQFKPHYGGQSFLEEKQAPLVLLWAHPSPKFTQQAGGRGHGALRDPFLQPPLCLASQLPSLLTPSPGLFVPPSEGREKGAKEAANCSCDVGVVVPFTALAIATRQKLKARGPSHPFSLPLFGQRPEGREAAGSSSS